MAKHPALKRWAIVQATPMPLPRGIQDARPGGTRTSSPDGASDLSKHFLTGNWLHAAGTNVIPAPKCLDAQAQGLHSRDRFVTRVAVRHGARNLRDFSNPTPIGFFLSLDGKSHAVKDATSTAKTKGASAASNAISADDPQRSNIFSADLSKRSIS
jgi:hypothetical protein